MNRGITELKNMARENLHGSLFGFIQAFVICNLIVTLVEMPFSFIIDKDTLSPQNMIYLVAIILITIASVVLTVGQYCLHLRVARKEKVYFKELYYPLMHDANRLIITEAILFVLELLATLPAFASLAIVYFFDYFHMLLLALVLSIVGCILTLWVSVTFKMVYFVLIDDEELSIKNAFKQTLALIKGHKVRFLYLELSFIGSYLLVLLTLGIAMLWVQPYIMHTTTLFYLDIKGELDKILKPAE
ncbi:MAG: DUF975 family protein [Agathobacter sp.]|nr:DUF975 family protein [Agathobacter sp.]